MLKKSLFALVVAGALGLAGWSVSDTSVAAGPNAPLKGGPPGGGCCDPDLEPGVGGNPFCFEGHTCCANGSWNCNNPDGSPSCEPGQVCDGCGSAGDSCDTDDDCCSGKCKGNGECK